MLELSTRVLALTKQSTNFGHFQGTIELSHRTFIKTWHLPEVDTVKVLLNIKKKKISFIAAATFLAQTVHNPDVTQAGLALAKIAGKVSFSSPEPLVPLSRRGGLEGQEALKTRMIGFVLKDLFRSS